MLIDPSPGPMVSNKSIVSIVDDDLSMREALSGLLKSAGLQAEVFASAEEFLKSPRLFDTACLVLDIRMPGMTGLQLQERLIASGHSIPIIFITSHFDPEERAGALERGAIDFLLKPFSDDALLESLGRIIGPGGGSGAG